MPVDAEADEVAASHRHLGVEGRTLRHVADGRVATQGGTAEHLEPSGHRGEAAQDHPDQSRLARAVGPKDRRERSARDGEGRAGPDSPRTVTRGQVERGDRWIDQLVADSTASRVRSCLSCQSWNMAPCGWRVSVTPTVGMCCDTASALRFVVTAVAV